MPLIQLIQMLKINLWMWYKVPQNQAQGPVVQNQTQGPAVQNPVQGSANQNQAQVPAGQIPTQGPAVQIPVQGPAQVGQNIPVQPPPQPAAVQPAPVGIVVPAPQIIYQNWIGKKPGISGTARRGCRIPSS